jgi:hypothetical protein
MTQIAQVVRHALGLFAHGLIIVGGQHHLAEHPLGRELQRCPSLFGERLHEIVLE